MTKKSESANTSTPFLVELPKLISSLILKRGRLLRSGEKLAVNSLPTFPGANQTAWVRAVSYQPTASGHPWDKAHELSSKVGRELSIHPYVEPEFSLDQTGFFYDLMQRTVSPPDSQPSEDGGQAAHDVFDSSLIPDPMKELRSVLPNSDFLPGFNIKGLSSPRSNSAFDFEAHFKEPNSPLGAATATEEQSPAGLGSQTRFSFPLLYSMPTWVSLATSTKRMFEVEAVQVYRCSGIRAQYPNLESSDLPNLSHDECQLIFKSLLELPMSTRLRRFLQS